MRRKHAKSIKSKFNDLMSTHPPLNEAYSDVCVFSLQSSICYIDLPNPPAELKKLKHKKCLVQSPQLLHGCQVPTMLQHVQFACGIGISS
ncbi:Aspartokinase [Zea mays]|uniref:Aspartokinase n=1 Tax=Zea mays TaxID=4577 RepID=A0A1D6GMK2_MAIZE|nr:Aspartokinase [Zea mays]AQK64512.1 Aspartokinase [Zea mays]